MEQLNVNGKLNVTGDVHVNGSIWGGGIRQQPVLLLEGTSDTKITINPDDYTALVFLCKHWENQWSTEYCPMPFLDREATYQKDTNANGCNDLQIYVNGSTDEEKRYFKAHIYKHSNGTLDVWFDTFVNCSYAFCYGIPR